MNKKKKLTRLKNSWAAWNKTCTDRLDNPKKVFKKQIQIPSYYKAKTKCRSRLQIIFPSLKLFNLMFADFKFFSAMKFKFSDYLNYVWNLVVSFFIAEFYSSPPGLYFCWCEWDTRLIDSPTSICIFSALLSKHFLRCWQGEFIQQSRVSLAGDHLLYSHDLNRSL